MADKDTTTGSTIGRKAPSAGKTSRPRTPKAGRTRTGPAAPPSPTELLEDLQALLADPRSPEALRRGLHALDRRFAPRSIFVSTHDPAFDRLAVALARGRADPKVQAAIPGEGTVGRAFSEKTLRCERGGQVVAVPMLARGRAVGVVTLLGGSFSGVDGAPSPEEATCLHAFANACGAALDMSLVRSELDHRNRDLRLATETLRDGDRTRDALLSHLSHELRTPLTTIKGYLSMGMKGRLGELSEKQQNAIAVCDRNADRLLRLINDLLLTARLEAGKMALDPKALGVRSVLLEAANFLESDAETAQVAFEVVAPEGEVFIRGNRDRLVECFMHLFERGLRGKRDGERVAILVEPRGRICSITVDLEGVHVPENELPRLFDAFRTDGGPANVGLSIARRIVELHGGHVRAEQDERGLRFQAALPLFAGAVTNVSEALQPSRGEILVIEDDDDCRNGIVDYLSGEGFTVRAYAEGRSALEHIQGDAPPALVLLDLRIPGVDGAALIQAVREGRRAQRTPIYVISGAIDAGAGADEAWGERVDGVFEKPINFPFLLERVRELVEAEGG